MGVRVVVPGLLAGFTGGRRRFEITASTLADALAELFRAHPPLRVHVLDETGRVRPHVLVYLNDDNVTRLDRLDRPVRPGDELRVIQAVSGG